jgi:hypothetical protein
MQSATDTCWHAKVNDGWLVVPGSIITTTSTFTMPELRYFHCSLIMVGWNRVLLINLNDMINQSLVTWCGKRCG